eukprot:COSAG06_NODE_12384_length_1388_cov_70.503491_2_plen_68_part_00
MGCRYVDGIPYRNDEDTARLLPNLMKGGNARCTLGCHYWSAANPQYNADGELIPGEQAIKQLDKTIS